MKKFSNLVLISALLFSFVSLPTIASAKGVSRSRTYYKSAKSGRFTTKSYSASHKSTTYKSSYKKSSKLK